MSVYSDVTSELYGEDKEEAMKVIDDDQQFDAWLKKFADKQKKGSHEKPKGKSVDKEAFMNRKAHRLPRPGVK